MTNTSEMVLSLNCRYGKFKQLDLYTVISKSTAPAHLTLMLFYIG